MLQVYEADGKDLWHVFREHHYLNGDINKAARLYLVYWNDVLVGMSAVLSMPCGTLKYAFCQHRLVVLPDFQGLGIGTKLNDFIAEKYVSNGNKFFIRTTHAKIIKHLENNNLWRATSKNKNKRPAKEIQNNKIKNGNEFHKGDQRIASSYEYLGLQSLRPKKYIKIKGSCDVDKLVSYIKSLKDNFYIVVVTGVPKFDSEVEIEIKKLGVRIEQLYYNKKGELIESSKYKNIEEMHF